MRADWLFVAPLTAAVVWGALGCAHTESAGDRQINELREEIARVQTDRDRFEQRMTALELAAAETKKAPAAGGAAQPRAPQVAATPKLRVVRVNPDGSEEGQTPAEAAGTPQTDDPEDSSPRPTIRVAGTPDRRPDPRRAAGYRPPDPGTDDAQFGVRPSGADPEAKRAYEAALALVNGRQYPQALEAFAAFLVKWPDHPYADNALYWRGEAYFAQGDYLHAAEQFDGVVARFPQGNKAADALLKLGICQQKLGNPAKAKTYFEKLAREFPRSDAARRIPSDRQEKP